MATLSKWFGKRLITVLGDVIGYYYKVDVDINLLKNNSKCQWQTKFYNIDLQKV